MSSVDLAAIKYEQAKAAMKEIPLPPPERTEVRRWAIEVAQRINCTDPDFVLEIAKKFEAYVIGDAA